jgi:hypothetical protein
MQLMRPLLSALALVAGLTATSRADDPAPTPAVPADPYAPIPADPYAPTPTPVPADDDVMKDILQQNAAKANEAATSGDEPVTGTVRAGAYHDSDQTTVLRVLGSVGHNYGNWVFSGTVDVDSVTSASVDVRSSPGLSKVDTVTSASGRSSSSGGEMIDTRYQLSAGAGWKDTSGHALNLTGSAASENDYQSLSGGINGSYDILDRNATLLGGFTLTDNWVSSVLDSSIHRKMIAYGWSAGIARVLSPDDAIRVRYDGKDDVGYNSSPYRNVRFGDWTANLGGQKITFMNTIGSADGLIEKTPETRISHALVGEWVHSLSPGIGLHPELRLSHDSWGVSSLSAGIDLRIARASWRMQIGYRYYLQSGADFFQDKYTLDPAMYAYYTSDKELGSQNGHLGRLDLAHVLVDADGPNDTRVMFNIQLQAVHYNYPGFVLLPSRDSVFGLVGLSLER